MPLTRLWQPEQATGRGEGRHGADGINWGSGLVLAEPLALTGAQVSNSISAASIASIYTSPANMEGSILTMAGYFTQLVGGGLAGKDVPGIPIGYIYNSYKLIRNNYHAML